MDVISARCQSARCLFSFPLQDEGLRLADMPPFHLVNGAPSQAPWAFRSAAFSALPCPCPQKLFVPALLIFLSISTATLTLFFPRQEAFTLSYFVDFGLRPVI